ncbi:MAG: winged helix DNA-binding domain-containing protein, partial [Bifidobacteriaceae bacterium]|nr:winged helix DNA-binding domain-containing protein [Bifidobacteriaceae bacterium]
DRAEDLSPEAATRRLVWRYLGAHGPASERDLAWWCHLPLSQLRPALRSFRDGLRAYAYRGETLWARADTVRDAAPPAERIMLLPGFDELLLGYQDRSATLAPAHAVHVTPHNNGIFRRTVTRDGRVIALWNARPGAGGVTVEVTGLSRDLAERDLPGLRRAATRYARYLGLPKARVQLRAPLP